MDLGHYNCRNYYITPAYAVPGHGCERTAGIGRPAATTTGRASLGTTAFQRHESFDELEQRSRSPASYMPKFPLLRLPLELRQQILSYLLPRTIEKNVQAGLRRGVLAPLTRRCNASGVCDGYPRTSLPAMPIAAQSQVVWQRGNIKVMSVCKQLHAECAAMLYGDNTFLLFVTYADITFRCSWVLPSGLNPTKRYPFPEAIPTRYRQLMRRVIVHLEHVDAYTSMTKFNVSGKGLVHGLCRQAQRLVDALQPDVESDITPNGSMSEAAAGAANKNGAPADARHDLIKMHIRVSSANSIVDEMKRLRLGGSKIEDERLVADLDQMLSPFADLRGVRDAAVTGAVPLETALDLEQRMMSMDLYDSSATHDIAGTAPPAHAVAADATLRRRRRRSIETSLAVPLCVYGNDIGD